MKHCQNLFCFLVTLLALANLPATAADEPATATQAHQAPYLTAEEEAKTIVLQPGYHLQLVVSDPIIKEPVVGMFDGNGRMFVVEMRTYMQNIDGIGEHERAGQVSLHWSSKGDGVFDKHTVFADHLLLPRMILPMADGLLINETDSNDLWLYRDTNGDGVSDKKELFYHGGPRGGNLEHQQSGLIWGRDNWMYMAVNAYRLRVRGTNVIQEPTGPNGGQWGINQDDYGKMWFVNAGGEIGPLNFQQPIVYGAFRIKGQMIHNFEVVWPLAGVGDFQGGLGRARKEDNTLNHFTATCGDEIYRGDRLPVDARGDLFFAEPVGRLVRRAKIEVKDGVTILCNAYEKSEFIRSTDLNFRPVNMMTAPDGTLYIVDMYRGIIQESAWVDSKSYLRPVVQKYHMEDNFGRGRIWRVVHDDFKPGPPPRMQEETPAQLVKHLDHPNGWWRDTAQKLLVLRGDKSVVPSLIQMARNNPNHLARIHALWTLEGLEAIDGAFIREKLKDEHPQVRIAAIRASETLLKNGDASLVKDIQALSKDASPDVVIQVMLTAHLLKWPDAASLSVSIMSENHSRGVQEIGAKLIPPPPGDIGFNDSEKKQLQHGKAIYAELCFACHGSDGKGTPLQGGASGSTIAPPLDGSKTLMGHRDGVLSVVLKGLAGPVNGKAYSALMVPMESNDDEWVADVTSFVRETFGKHSSLISAKDVAAVRARLQDRTQPWTEEELQASLPQPLANHQSWKVTASEHPQAAALAIDGKLQTRYDSGKIQVPGMWFQIELPQPTSIAGIQLDAANDVHDFPRDYQVELSDDGHNWGKPVAAGKGVNQHTEISFAPATTKFIRITQTGSSVGYFWSIHELSILASPQIQIVAANGTKSGAALFSFSDITNLKAFATKLKQPADHDELSKYLHNQLSRETLKVLSEFEAGSNPRLQAALIDDINHVVQGGPLYTVQRFASVKLSPVTSSLLAENLRAKPSDKTNPDGAAAAGQPSATARIAKLNRQLLLDAYPQEMGSTSKTSSFE